MKAKTLIVVAAAVFSLVVVATPADAAASCNKATTPSCPGVVCYGYTNGHWQTCVGGGPSPCDTMRCFDPCDLFVNGCNPCGTVECYPPWSIQLP